MAIEEKLDQIISILLRIERNLRGVPEHTAAQDQIVKYKKEPKPTAAQLKFQEQMEFNIEMRRKFFLKAIRNRAAELLEKRKTDPDFKIPFTDKITLKLIDEKIAKSPALFYRDLKKHLLKQMESAQADGERALDRAIGRLTARVK